MPRAQATRSPASWIRLFRGEVRKRLGLTLVPVQLDGDVRILADLTTPIGTDAYRHRSWRPLEPAIAEVVSRLQAGQTFVDGGANIGLFSLIAARTVGPTGRVVAFEPARDASMALAANVALNGFEERVDLRRAALSDQVGSRTFVDLGGASGFSSFAPGVPGGNLVEVPTQTLDACLNDADVALVKLDLEGAEVSALRGATSLLRRGVPFLVEVEDAHLQRQGSSASGLMNVFAEAGYHHHQAAGPNVMFER